MDSWLKKAACQTKVVHYHYLPFYSSAGQWPSAQLDWLGPYIVFPISETAQHSFPILYCAIVYLNPSEGTIFLYVQVVHSFSVSTWAIISPYMHELHLTIFLILDLPLSPCLQLETTVCHTILIVQISFSFNVMHHREKHPNSFTSFIC